MLSNCSAVRNLRCKAAVTAHTPYTAERSICHPSGAWHCSTGPAKLSNSLRDDSAQRLTVAKLDGLRRVSPIKHAQNSRTTSTADCGRGLHHGRAGSAPPVALP
jgi:hypothetical protein